MRQCRSCGKEIPDTKYCCNENCVRKYIQQQINERENRLFYRVRKLCLNCYQEIRNDLDYCSISCIIEQKYGSVAKSGDYVSRDGRHFSPESESVMDYMKRRKQEEEMRINDRTIMC